jgi:hypothetical protein
MLITLNLLIRREDYSIVQHIEVKA